MATNFLKYALPVLQANTKFAASVTAWVIIESAVTVLRDREDSPLCSDGSFWWLSMLLAGMVLGILGGLGDLLNDLNLRFREGHVCVLARSTEDGWEPFRSVRKLSHVNSEKDLRVGELLYDETAFKYSSKIYLVEAIQGNAARTTSGNYGGMTSPVASVNRLDDAPEVELDKQGLLEEEQKSGADAAGALESGGELRDQDDFEEIVVKRYVGSSGSFPMEVTADNNEDLYNGAIVRNPQWLMVWTILRCTTSIMFFIFFVYVTSIPLFDRSCEFGRRQVEGKFIGPALAGLFVSLVFKSTLPSLPSKDNGGEHRPQEMDQKIAWIWHAAHKEQFQQEVYDQRWQGFQTVLLHWKITFVIYMVLLLATPFFSLYIWGAYGLAHAEMP